MLNKSKTPKKKLNTNNVTKTNHPLNNINLTNPTHHQTHKNKNKTKTNKQNTKKTKNQKPKNFIGGYFLALLILCG